jgi:hypothetical protein
MNRFLFHCIFPMGAAVLLIAFAEASGPFPPSPAYRAAVTIEVKPPGNDAEGLLRKHLPKGNPSVRLVAVRNTGLFEIAVIATDPKVAAQRANELAEAVKKAIEARQATTIVLWDRAEPPGKRWNFPLPAARAK